MLFDGGVGFRLPKRLGLVSLDIQNILDQKFRFQDDNFRLTEPLTYPRFVPDRTFIGRVTLNF
jgi:hypothetical protein